MQSGLGTVKGPRCSRCEKEEFVVLSEMARGISRAECTSCGETNYIPTPPRR